MHVGYRRDTQPGCKIILSSHNFHTTPPDHELSAVLRDMYLAGADIAKIATTAQDITDALRLLAVLKASPGGSHIVKVVADQSWASLLVHVFC